MNKNIVGIWKLVRTYIRIYSYQNLATNEYPNIFVSKKLTRTNIRLYSYPKNDTNEYPNKHSDQKYSNIRIYSSHSERNCWWLEQRIIVKCQIQLAKYQWTPQPTVSQTANMFFNKLTFYWSWECCNFHSICSQF